MINFLNCLCWLCFAVKVKIAQVSYLYISFFFSFSFFFFFFFFFGGGGRSGSVVECLTRDRRAAGSSLTGVTAQWSLSKTHLS